MVTLAVRSKNFLGVFAPAPPPPGSAIARLPFADNFESGSFAAWDAVGGVVTSTTLEAFDGVRSAMTEAFVGQQSDNYLEFHFGDHQGVAGNPTAMNDLWCRFTHKWASNYVDTDSAIIGQKLWLLNSHNPATNRRRYQVTFNIAHDTSLYFFDCYRWNEDTTFGGTLASFSVPNFPRVLGRWEEFVFRIRQNTPGLSDGQIQCWTKAQGDSGFVERVNRTNLNLRDATAFTPNRLIGLSNYDTITTRSGRRYWDSIQLQQEAIDVSSPPPADNDGLIVTNFAQYDPDAAEFMSLDVNSTLPNMNGFNGGIVTFENQPWWNGSSVGICRMRPPTVGDSRSGLGGLTTGWPLWKNATKAVRQLNFRIEAMFSDAFLLESSQYPKYFIFQIYNELNPNPSDGTKRPMFFIAHGNQDANLGVPNSIVFSPAMGTLRMYSSTNIIPAADANDRIASGDTDPGTFGTMLQPFYIRSTAGVDAQGHPIIPSNEVVCMEIRLQMMSTAAEPDGVVGFRMYRRNGEIFERCCSLQWDTSYLVNTYYIAGIDSFGGGYYNNAQASDPAKWTMVGRRISIAFNYQPTVGRAWKGPPTGFVQ